MQQLPAFIHALAPPALQDLFSAYGEKELHEAGTLLVKAGDPPQRLYLLTQGHCCFIHTDAKGLSRSCGILPPGGMCGYGPVIQRRPSTVSVMCLDSAVTLRLDVDTFMRHVQPDLAVYSESLEHLLKSYGALYGALLFQFSINLPQRLANFLRAYAACVKARPGAGGRIHLPLKLTHERLGAIINATRVTTTLLLNHLTRLDMLEQSRDGLSFPARLVDPKFILNELSQKRWAHTRGGKPA